MPREGIKPNLPAKCTGVQLTLTGRTYDYYGLSPEVGNRTRPNFHRKDCLDSQWYTSVTLRVLLCFKQSHQLWLLVYRFGV